MTIRYFGVWGHPGHYLWTADGRLDRDDRRLSRLIDGNLAPQPERPRRPYQSGPPVQPEGFATVTRVAGLTIVAFWDRSGDRRFGSNSAFVADGEHCFDEVMAAAREAFPSIFKRFTFEVHQ